MWLLFVLYHSVFHLSCRLVVLIPLQVDLPTLLKDRYLSIDVGRFGRLIDIRINGFQSVSIADGIANDGVIHVVNSVIIPPKRLGGELQHWQGEDLTIEDLTERLEPFVKSVEVDVKDNLDL
jgi:hypothetical protein